MPRAASRACNSGSAAGGVIDPHVDAVAHQQPAQHARGARQRRVRRARMRRRNREQRPGIARFSSAGVSQMRIVPACSSASREHRSASSM